jgi:hypothetical protein
MTEPLKPCPHLTWSHDDGIATCDECGAIECVNARAADPALGDGNTDTTRRGQPAGSKARVCADDKGKTGSEPAGLFLNDNALSYVNKLREALAILANLAMNAEQQFASAQAEIERLKARITNADELIASVGEWLVRDAKAQGLKSLPRVMVKVLAHNTDDFVDSHKPPQPDPRETVMRDMAEALDKTPLPYSNGTPAEFYSRFYAWYEGLRHTALSQHRKLTGEG